MNELEIDVNEIGNAAPSAAADAVKQEDKNPKHLKGDEHEASVLPKDLINRLHSLFQIKRWTTAATWRESTRNSNPIAKKLKVRNTPTA